MRNIIVNAAPYALGATGQRDAPPHAIAIPEIRGPSGKATALYLTVVMPN